MLEKDGILFDDDLVMLPGSNSNIIHVNVHNGEQYDYGDDQ